MRKILDKIELVERIVITVVFMMATAVVVFQILNRNVLHLSAAWSEELARYLIIWVSLLAGAYGFKTQQHICVDAVTERYPPKMKVVVSVIADLIVIAFSVILVYKGGGMVALQLSTNQTSAALKWPMAYLYLSIPVGYGLTILAIFSRRLDEIQAYLSKKKGEVE